MLKFSQFCLGCPYLTEKEDYNQEDFKKGNLKCKIDKDPRECPLSHCSIEKKLTKKYDYKEKKNIIKDERRENKKEEKN